jgi:hypothetical protein
VKDPLVVYVPRNGEVQSLRRRGWWVGVYHKERGKKRERWVGVYHGWEGDGEREVVMKN